MADEQNTISSLPELSLSFWMAGLENSRLGRAAYAWFSRLGERSAWAIKHRDPLTCDPIMLDLLAYERGIVRRGDSERLYRLRVYHAYNNAADAGWIAGWRRIFERLELLPDGDELTLLERFAWRGVPQDWDVIGIFLSDERQAELQEVIEKTVIEDYGRTCRRYYLTAYVSQAVIVGVSIFDDDHTTTLCASAVLASHREGVLIV